MTDIEWEEPPPTSRTVAEAKMRAMKERPGESLVWARDCVRIPGGTIERLKRKGFTVKTRTVGGLTTVYACWPKEGSDG